MATTRARRTRKTTQATPVHIGGWRDLEPGNTTHPIRIADIETWPAPGRRERIGDLIHRDYESGYPERWEVGRLGGTTWGWYPTEEEARTAAGAYATAYVAQVNSPTGVSNFADVANPDELQRVHQDTVRGGYRAQAAARIEARALLVEAEHLAQHIADAGPHAEEAAHDRRTAIDHELAALVPVLLGDH